MRLAVSVIGWEPEHDANALVVVSRAGIEGVEAAPTRLWGSWEASTESAVREWADGLAAHGLTCPALQSLFFGVEGASLTGGDSERRTATDHLVRVARIAGWLGARVAVLGSPANRRMGDLSYREATRRAREALLPAADAFAAAGAMIALEPNPHEYDCDFLVSYAEVADFVEAADHPALRTQLDTGALLITGEEPDVGRVAPAHVHLSAPHLVPFDGQPRERYGAVMDRLESVGYDGWLSIEQRPHGSGLAAVERAAAAARELAGQPHA